MHARTTRLVLAALAVATVTSAEALDSAACAPIVNGAATGISAAAGAQLCFTAQLPYGQSSLAVTTSGGVGNADLYVRFGSVPTLRAYDCRSSGRTTGEDCRFADPRAGTWYVMVYARAAFSGASLTATHGGPSCTPIENGLTVPNIAAGPGASPCFVMTVPDDQTTATVTTAGGTGNADLYVRKGWVPTLRAYDCRSAGRTTTESCNASVTAAGPWYVMLNPRTAFSGVSLTAFYNRARLALVSGGGQVGPVNTALSAPVVVRLEDDRGVPLAGALVRFDVTDGGGAVTTGSATTGSDGTASVGWTLGPTRTPQALRASATDPYTAREVEVSVTADASGSLVVNTLDDAATAPAGSLTLRHALATASPGETISFAAALDGGTILLDVVGEEHSALRGEVYVNNAFAGYQDRDYGKSALYAQKDVVIDASALEQGIALAWNGGSAAHARVLAVYGNLTMKNVTVTSGYSAADAIATTQAFTLARGGGIAVWGVATLDHCTIAGNTIVGDTQASRDRGTYGGGIYANGLVLSDVIVSGNTATGFGAAGGGIYSVGGADKAMGRGNDTYLERCTVSGNRVTAQHGYGGGVFTLSGGPNNLATMEIANSTVARNLVEDNPDLPDVGQYYHRGGGVYMGGGSLSVVASTIAENAVSGPYAVFGGKPNIGGGGVAATIGNAHTVEYVWLQNSIAVGNTVNDVAEDWYPGSILDFRSCGYNAVGRIDFSQILVPVPAWMNLNRRRWPQAGDMDGVTLDQGVDVAGARFHPTIVSAGTDAGEPALLSYPPGPAALNRIPAGSYQLTYVNAGYSGYGVATDDFLNQVILQLRSEYGAILGGDFGASFGDLTGTTWYEAPVTWPSDPRNTPWIDFWRALDVALGDGLGMGGLGDGFWGTFTTGAVGNEALTISRTPQWFAHEATDQLGHARPSASSALTDIGAIEK